MAKKVKTKTEVDKVVPEKAIKKTKKAKQTSDEEDEPTRPMKAKEVNLEDIKVGKDRPKTLPGDAEWYPAKFKDASVQDGQYGPLVFLNFEITKGTNEDGETVKGVVISAMAGYETAPSSKFMGLVSKITGAELDEDEEIDLKSHYGKKFDVFTEIKEGGKKGPIPNITKIAKYNTKTK